MKQLSRRKMQGHPLVSPWRLLAATDATLSGKIEVPSVALVSGQNNMLIELTEVEKITVIEQV